MDSKVLGSLICCRVIQPADHAVNYHRDTAVGVTELPLQGNPVSGGGAWG